jgi:hypothetical protein
MGPNTVYDLSAPVDCLRSILPPPMSLHTLLQALEEQAIETFSLYNRNTQREEPSNISETTNVAHHPV